MTWMSEAAGAGEEAGAVPDEPQRGRPAEAEKPPEAAAPSQPEAGGTAEAAEPQIGEAEGAEGPPAVADGAEERPSAPTAGQAAEPPEAPPAPAEARPSAEERPANVDCIEVTYDRCSALGITEILVERAKREPAGVKLALLALWRGIIASLKADAKALEPLWLGAGLDPQASISAEDRARAEAVAEEALAGCRLCTVDLAAFLKAVRRVTLAERPDGDAVLVVDVGYNGDEVSVATKLGAWVKETKDGTRYTIPFVLRERLRHIGLAVDADPRDLYVELVRRAERYPVVVDAYIRPILLHVVEALRASPHFAKCTKDGQVILVATELFRTSRWYFDARVGLGRNKLYGALRRYGLLARADTVVAEFHDEYGERVRRRALAFLISKLSAFIEYDVKQLCRASGLMAEEEGEPQNAPPKAGP
jgi:hypothetical protein